ncbi:MAG: hypothetical protein RMJ51_00595 [Candidatus Calescibacterium sp.]|nr:hypothetical protein [Candidatus Calescibacterium sp.]MCX7972671.1 hypothetical protein [bacterium]MDW8194732.1 hypothetical protein [Candidatus Calescibacterium sp.]
MKVGKFLLLILMFILCKVKAFEPVLMFFSNSPEYVKKDGYLISGTISGFTPTLIYFYHLNDTLEDKKIYLVLTGKCEAYINFAFSSSKDSYFKVGNDIAREIFKNFNPTKYYIDGRYIFEIDFKPQFLVSGYFWIYSNGRIDFDSWVGNVKYRYILPTDRKHVKGIFGIGRIVTYVPEDLNYLVVGDIPLDGIETNMVLKGTYKVFYHFIVNRRIRSIYFSARGGPSIPIYLIKSSYEELVYTSGGVYRPYDEIKIFDREIYMEELITQPIGACYYPVYYRIDD